jgi:glucans biosynthesis protein C
MNRRPDVDGLRVFATYLLFIFHAAKVFDPMPFFHVRNREVSSVFYILAGFISQWHMPLFFLLAGWSIVASLRARGLAAFLKDRVFKLGIPLVTGCLVFGAAVKYVELRSGLDLNHGGLRMSAEMQEAIRPFGVALPTLPAFEESFLEFLPTYFTRLDRFTWSHLWFLAYLWVLSVAYCPIIFRIVRGRERWPQAGAFWIHLPLLPLLAVQLGLRTRFPGIYNLYNDWANVAFYSVYLFAGVFLAHHAGLERAVERTWKRTFAVGTVAMLVLLASALQLIASPVALLTASTIAGWCYVVTLVGLARERMRSTGRILSYLSESAFPVYILHQPVLVFVAYFVVRLDVGIAVKFPMLVVASVCVTLALYHFVFRRVPLLRFAFGMKPRKRLSPHEGSLFHSTGRLRRANPRDRIRIRHPEELHRGNQ